MFGKNLIYLRKTNNWTQSALAEKLDIARTTLGDYERGKTEPNFQMLNTLSDLFGVDIDTLINTPLHSAEASVVFGERGSRRYVNQDASRMQAIDLVETKAEAGYLESFQDPEYIRDLPKIYMPHFPANEYRGFEIEGDSMQPIESGTIIIGVKVESLDEIRDFRTYVIITKRDGMVYKRIRKNPSNLTLVAISDNPDYPAYTIDYDSIAEVWQYYAHIGFSDTSSVSDPALTKQLDDIQQKVTELYRRQETVHK